MRLYTFCNYIVVMACPCNAPPCPPARQGGAYPLPRLLQPRQPSRARRAAAAAGGEGAAPVQPPPCPRAARHLRLVWVSKDLPPSVERHFTGILFEGVPWNVLLTSFHERGSSRHPFGVVPWVGLLGWSFRSLLMRSFLCRSLLYWHPWVAFLGWSPWMEVPFLDPCVVSPLTDCGEWWVARAGATRCICVHARLTSSRGGLRRGIPAWSCFGGGDFGIRNGRGFQKFLDVWEIHHGYYLMDHG